MRVTKAIPGWFDRSVWVFVLSLPSQHVVLSLSPQHFVLRPQQYVTVGITVACVVNNIRMRSISVNAQNDVVQSSCPSRPPGLRLAVVSSLMEVTLGSFSTVGVGLFSIFGGTSIASDCFWLRRS